MFAQLRSNRSVRHAALSVLAGGTTLALLVAGCPTSSDALAGDNGGNAQSSDSVEQQVMQIINDLIASGQLVGSTGPQGPAGETGATGATGSQGATGPKGDPGASPFELIGNDAVYTQGNVGIGTDSPAVALDVDGDINATGTVSAGAFSSNGSFKLQTSGATRMYVDEASGHVGVGTTSLSSFALMKVAGALQIRDAEAGLTISPETDKVNISYSEVGGGSNIADIRFASISTNNAAVGVRRQPAANDLEVQGNASKTTAGSWLANSDARIKTDVTTVTNALDTLDKVRLVSFRYTDDYRAKNPEIADHDYLNVIAQEFCEVFPDYVKGSGEKLADGDEILQVDTYPLTIYAAAAAQELHRMLLDRDGQIQAQQKKIDNLEARLAKLEAALAEDVALRNN